jgi:hypothetical protein
MIKAHQCLIQKTAYILKNKKMLENYAFSGTPHKPISYIDQGTKLTCSCGYEWIENRFPEYPVCPRCDRRQMERDSRNLVQSSSTSAKPLRTSPQQSQINEILELLNFGTIDPLVTE